MPSFQEQFEASGGMPIEYRGQTLRMVDDYPVPDARIIRLELESADSEWRQGVYLTIESGRIVVEGKDCQNGAVLWYDSAPQSVHVEIAGDATTIQIRNVWDTGNGVLESWHHGAAMIVEEGRKQRRYRCNDGHPDDDFNDLVFSVGDAS